jgi:PadR family transcriptional regulator, regulatory protein PadR
MQIHIVMVAELPNLSKLVLGLDNLGLSVTVCYTVYGTQCVSPSIKKGVMPPNLPLEINSTELNERLRLELRRGSLALAVLAALREEEYAYSLRKKLQNADIDIEEGTLYPLVRRLEQQGLLHSTWREGDNRERRYYCISVLGLAVLETLTVEWKNITQSLKNLLEETP